MNFCWIGIHKYGKYKDFSEEKYTSTIIDTYTTTKRSMLKIVQKRTCEVCGKIDYDTQNIQLGYK